MAFDAEQYLRDRAARFRVEPGQGRQPDSSSLASAAAALIAIGALSPPGAEHVLDEFDLGWDVEFAQCRPGWGSASQRVGYIPLPRLSGARVVGLGDELCLPPGTLRLRYTILEMDSTALVADFRVGDKPPTGLRDWIRVPSGMPSGLSRPELLDESGMMRLLEFNGHGNDDRWSGQFFTCEPIPKDASWIELYGTRIELNRSPVPAAMTIEPSRASDRAQMHLLRVLASADPFQCQDATAAAEALVACGALDPDDSVIAVIKAAGNHATDPRLALAYPQKLSGLPEPWPTPRAHKVLGPERTLVTGATTERFEGHQVAVLALRSSSDHFIVEAEVTSADSNRSILEDRELIWWARDDRGQNYLGTWIGSGRVAMSGELSFFPALDPDAAELELLPSAPTMRAIIKIPLGCEAPASTD